MMQFVELCDSDQDGVRLERFYDELFVPGFPHEDERESLRTLRDNFTKAARGFYGRNAYHILLALEDERPVAGCIMDYLVQSNSGAIEYITVTADRRGEGLGSAIHNRAVETAAADARTAGQNNLNAILIEVSDPCHACTGRDAVDGAARAMMWHHWGYQRLVFPYRQPALSPH